EPGWKIEVDGVETEAVKLVKPTQQTKPDETKKYAFIGIEVPPGTHTVTMRFMPDYFIIGILVTLVGAAAVFVIWIFERRSKKLLLNKLHEI
ncbi:MAG: YfhO family protein, partial [Oscillospiraceae bacterium]